MAGPPEPLVPADTATRRVTVEIEGAGRFDQWSAVEIVRDLHEFAGSFTVIARDSSRSVATFDWASPPPLYRLRPGPGVRIYIDRELVLTGYIDKVRPELHESFAEVTLSGRDSAGDLVDCAAAAEGPGEYRRITLDEAARRICAPFAIAVRSEIDPGAPFERYPLELAETGLAAIEKGARQRHALVLSDGTGNVVLTRTGRTRAPADLVLPGNMKGSSAEYSHEGRYSLTIVRAQGERAGGRRAGRPAAFVPGDDPTTPEERASGDGSATERERHGTAVTGRAIDPEITRYRPIVHLAKTQADATAAEDEADWRMRTARAAAETLVTRVHGFRASGKLWAVNQIAYVSDAFQGIERDLLISRTVYRYDDRGEEAELSLTSPEAFDARPVGRRRTNRPTAKSKSPTAQPALDTTAQAL